MGCFLWGATGNSSASQVGSHGRVWSFVNLRRQKAVFVYTFPAGPVGEEHCTRPPGAQEGGCSSTTASHAAHGC